MGDASTSVHLTAWVSCHDYHHIDFIIQSFVKNTILKDAIPSKEI